MKNIYGLIRRLGANSKYKGYFFTAEAVKISMGYQYKRHLSVSGQKI